ncbi:MAG: hypothetical protein Q8O86_06255 [Dehalococcoidia bacterium]|nr:hypothetical protein [Dehalococcoidia bacterium]
MEDDLVAAAWTLDLIDSARCVTLPSGSGLKKSVGREVFNAEVEIVDEPRDILLVILLSLQLSAISHHPYAISDQLSAIGY